MPKIKEGKVARKRLEEIFDTNFFYQPGIRDNGKYNFNIIKEKKKQQNCDSLFLYRTMQHYSLVVRVMLMTKFFCIDIDNKPDKQSVYYDNLQPILDCLDELGLEGRIICSNTEGGRKIWIPLPITIIPQIFNNQLEQHFRLKGLVVAKGTLELLGRQPTAGVLTYYRYKNGGRSHYVTNVSQAGDAVRLPHPPTEYLQLNSLYDEPKAFTYEDFYGKYWERCMDVNSEFSYETLRNALTPIDSDPNAGGELTTEHQCVCSTSVNRVLPLDTASTPAILGTNNQVNQVRKNHGGKRAGAGRKSGTKEDRYLESTSFGQKVLKAEFLNHCLDRVNQGWTHSSQSNEIMACLAVVVCHTYRSYSDLQIAQEMLTIIPKIKGFEEHASNQTKKDLAQSLKRNWARRWAKSVCKYRSKLFAANQIERKHDYVLKYDEPGGKWWIQSLTVIGKPTSKYSPNKGVGKGNGRKANRLGLVNTPDTELTAEQLEYKRLAIELGVEV